MPALTRRACYSKITAATYLAPPEYPLLYSDISSVTKTMTHEDAVNIQPTSPSADPFVSTMDVNAGNDSPSGGRRWTFKPSTKPWPT